MRTSFLIFAITLISTLTSAQQSEMLLKTFGGEQPDEFTHLVEMENNEIWAVGSTGSNLQGNSDVWLQRTNENLDCIASETFASPGVDRAEYIVKDESGNAYIVGYTNGFGASEYDALIIKINSGGDMVWTKTIGNADWDFATCAAWFNGELYIGGYTFLDASVSSAWLVRLDSEGEILSQQVWSDSGDAWMNDLLKTSDNNILLMYTSVNSTSGLHDVKILKLDQNGNVLWQHTRSLTTEDSKGISFFEHNHIYFCAGTRELNGLISPFVTHLSESGSYLEEFQQEQPDDYYIVRAMVTDVDKTYAMTTRAFGGGGSDGGFLNFTPFYGFISSVTIGEAGEEYLNDAILTSSGKYIGCGAYGSFSDQLNQGMLAVLPDVNPEGYFYSLADESECFVVGISETSAQELKNYSGNWTVYDVAGKKVAMYTGTEGQLKIQLQQLPMGIYLAQPQMGGALKYLIGR